MSRVTPAHLFEVVHVLEQHAEVAQRRRHGWVRRAKRRLPCAQAALVKRAGPIVLVLAVEQAGLGPA